MAKAISNLSTTWANSSNIYTGIGLNVNGVAYNANSAMIDLKLNSNSLMKLTSNGVLYVNGAPVGSSTGNVSLAWDTANAAFGAANAASGTAAVEAFNKANSANILAGIAYDKANSANILAFNTGVGANSFASATIAGANLITSAAFAVANNANLKANLAWDAANTVRIIANSAYDKANSANLLAANAGVGLVRLTPVMFGATGSGIDTANLRNMLSYAANTRGSICVIDKPYTIDDKLTINWDYARLEFAPNAEIIVTGSNTMYGAIDVGTAPSALSGRTLTANSARYSNTITLSSTAGISNNDILRLDWLNPLTTVGCAFVARVAEVVGNVVTLSHPLPWDLPNGLSPTTLTCGRATKGVEIINARIRANNFTGPALAGIKLLNVDNFRSSHTRTQGCISGGIVCSSSVDSIISDHESYDDGSFSSDAAFPLYGFTGGSVENIAVRDTEYFAYMLDYIHYTQFKNLSAYRVGIPTSYVRAFKTWDFSHCVVDGLVISDVYGQGTSFQNVTRNNTLSNWVILNVKQGIVANSPYPAQGITTNGTYNTNNTFTFITCRGTQSGLGATDISIGANDKYNSLILSDYDTIALQEPNTTAILTKTGFLSGVTFNNTLGVGTRLPSTTVEIADQRNLGLRFSANLDPIYYREIGRDNLSSGRFIIRRAQGSTPVDDFVIDILGNVGIGTENDTLNHQLTVKNGANVVSYAIIGGMNVNPAIVAAFAAANSAGGTTANAAFDQANSANIIAVSAFAKANAALPNTSGITFAGNLNVSGNLSMNAVNLSPIQSFKNKIINGDFLINQRTNTSANNVATGAFLYDRWCVRRVGVTGNVFVQSFTAGQTDVPGEPAFYYRADVTDVASSSNYFRIQQRIESSRTLAGQEATISFWAKANSAKNIAIEFAQNFGTGGSPSSEVTGIGNTTFSLTTSWQKFVATVNIPSISGKTLGTTNDGYLECNFWLNAGSSFNSRTNNLGQQSIIFDMARVQVEAGRICTPFEERHIGAEQLLCDRYYQRYGGLAITDMQYRAYASGYLQTTLYWRSPLRATPTVTVAGTWGLVNCTAPFASPVTYRTARFQAAVTSSPGDTYFYTNSTNEYLDVDSEL